MRSDFQSFCFKFREVSDSTVKIPYEISRLCGFDFPAKQFDITSESLSMGSGLKTNSHPRNNQPSSKGDSSHPTGNFNWGKLWHKLNEPSIKWTRTRFILVSLLCFIAGGVAGVLQRWLTRKAQVHPQAKKPYISSAGQKPFPESDYEHAVLYAKEIARDFQSAFSRMPRFWCRFSHFLKTKTIQSSRVLFAGSVAFLRRPLSNSCPKSGPKNPPPTSGESDHSKNH
jgi:hypothetical protein